MYALFWSVFLSQVEHRTHCVKCHCKTWFSYNVLEYIQWPIFHAMHAIGLVYSIVISDKRSFWQIHTFFQLSIIRERFSTSKTIGINNHPSLKEQVSLNYLIISQILSNVGIGLSICLFVFCIFGISIWFQWKFY